MAKTVEIDEEQFLRDKKLRETVATIMANPKAKLLVQEAHKLVDPNAVTPDLDARKPLDEFTSNITKELAELKAQREADKAERERDAKLADLQGRVERGIAKLRGDGWTDDGIKGVRELMDAKGILDPEDAAAIFEKQHPPQAPVTPAPLTAYDYFNPPAEGGDEFLKALLKARGDSDGAVNKRVGETLAEVRGTRR